jgi:hypothetical protein
LVTFCIKAKSDKEIKLCKILIIKKLSLNLKNYSLIEAPLTTKYFNSHQVKVHKPQSDTNGNAVIEPQVQAPKWNLEISAQSIKLLDIDQLQ